MSNPKSLARVAGLLYLTLAACGAFAELYARSTVYVAGNAAAAADNIAEHATLFRLGLVADILMSALFVLLGLILYRLLRPAHPHAALALLVFVCVGASAIIMNLTFHVGALLLATDLRYALPPGDADQLALLMLDLHHYGYLLGGIFFGLWLLPMGYVATRGQLFPRWLGAVIFGAGVAWLLDPLLAFAAPGVPVIRDIVTGATAGGELTLILFLLIVGIRRPTAPPEPRADHVPKAMIGAES